MKIVIINKSDSRGGAAIVSTRLLNALRNEGIDARMLVEEKLTDSPFVAVASTPLKLKSAFLAERLQIFCANGFNRSKLFKVDTASFGVSVCDHPWVKAADVVMLNWVNQGFISLDEIRRMVHVGKKLIWTMHDLWCMTGICHHTDGCLLYQRECGPCQFLSRSTSKIIPEKKKVCKDLSSRIQSRKLHLYEDTNIHFVAVSSWLHDLAHKSSLLKNQKVSVIHNAFDPLEVDVEKIECRNGEDGKGKYRIVMGAARLDDTVKGLPVMVESTRIFANWYPELAKRVEFVTYGAIRDLKGFEGIAFDHQHLGKISGEKAIAELYLSANIVVSTSEYETLPGTLIEGQAYGAIPVSLDRGGQRDIVDDGMTGFLAKYHDEPKVRAERVAEAMYKALLSSGPEIRRRMAESVREKFSAEKIAGNYIKLCEKLLTE